MTDVEYIEIARNDPTWCEVVASMLISGFTLDLTNEILAGKMITGELSLREVTEIIVSRATSPVAGSQNPTDELRP